jgi:hypothetical protein
LQARKFKLIAKLDYHIGQRMRPSAIGSQSVMHQIGDIHGNTSAAFFTVVACRSIILRLRNGASAIVADNAYR